MTPINNKEKVTCPVCKQRKDKQQVLCSRCFYGYQMQDVTGIVVMCDKEFRKLQELDV